MYTSWTLGGHAKAISVAGTAHINTFVKTIFFTGQNVNVCEQCGM